MPISFENIAQELTYQRVAAYLTTSSLFQQGVKRDPDQPRFELLYGSTHVTIEIHVWGNNPWGATDLAIVRATSCVTQATPIEANLMRYLLTANTRLRFGNFHLGDHDEINFSHSVLGGEGMDLKELQTCLLTVITIADSYDDIIVEQFGGRRAID